MIGEILYIYDWNNHAYCDSKRVREPWIPLKVVGETRTSWVLEREVRVKKGTLEIRGSIAPGWMGVAYTGQGKDDAEWRDQHQAAILRLVQNADIPTLRQIAALVGYEEGE